jgi:hypothetical protein
VTKPKRKKRGSDGRLEGTYLLGRYLPTYWGGGGGWCVLCTYVLYAFGRLLISGSRFGSWFADVFFVSGTRWRDPEIAPQLPRDVERDFGTSHIEWPVWGGRLLVSACCSNRTGPGQADRTHPLYEPRWKPRLHGRFVLLSACRLCAIGPDFQNRIQNRRFFTFAKNLWVHF